jgi:hypothetical protein
MGFVIYCIGEEKSCRRIQHKQPEKDNVTIMPIVLEEPEEEIYV